MSTVRELPAMSTSAFERDRATELFRRHAGQISRQSSVFFAGTVFTAASGYAFKIFLARQLGAEQLGIYALGMTLVGFIGIFNGLGLPQSAVRFVAAYSATGNFKSLRAFLFRGSAVLAVVNLVFASFVAWVGPGLALRLYHNRTLATYMTWFVGIMLIGALTTFFSQVLAGYKDVSCRTIVTSFIGSPLMMLLSVALLLSGQQLRGYLIAQVISSVVVVALLVWKTWSLTPIPARTLNSPLVRMDCEVFAFSSTVFAIAIVEFVLAQADKVLIGMYLNAREVGIYAVATAIVSFVPIALQSVNQIFSPTIADLHARGEYAVLQRLFQTLTKWILGATLPLVIALVAFAAPLIRIFGGEFLAGWPVLVIGSLGQLVNCAVGSVGYLLLMSGHHARLLKVQAVMAVLMLVLNVALIPKWGLLGAALAAAITNVVSNAWYLLEVRSRLRLFPYNSTYLRLLPPLFVTSAVVLTFRPALGSLRPEWLAVCLSLMLPYAVFISVVLAFGLDADDRFIADALWSKVRGVTRSAAVVTS
jgi:O-antigen/teichoic acid export membrane protein